MLGCTGFCHPLVPIIIVICVISHISNYDVMSSPLWPSVNDFNLWLCKTNWHRRHTYSALVLTVVIVNMKMIMMMTQILLLMMRRMVVVKYAAMVMMTNLEIYYWSHCRVHWCYIVLFFWMKANQQFHSRTFMTIFYTHSAGMEE